MSKRTQGVAGGLVAVGLLFATNARAQAISGTAAFYDDPSCGNTCTGGYVCTWSGESVVSYPDLSTVASVGDIVFKNSMGDLPATTDVVTPILENMGLNYIHVGVVSPACQSGKGPYCVVEDTMSSTALTGALDTSRLSTSAELGLTTASPGDIRLYTSSLLKGTPGTQTEPLDGWTDAPLVLYQPRAGTDSSGRLFSWDASYIELSMLQSTYTYSLYGYSNWFGQLENDSTMCSGSVAAAAMELAPNATFSGRTYSVTERAIDAQNIYVSLVNSVFQLVNQKANSAQVGFIGLSIASQQQIAWGMANQLINCFANGDCNDPTETNWVNGTGGLGAQISGLSFPNGPAECGFWGPLGPNGNYTYYCPNGSFGTGGTLPYPSLSATFSVSPDDLVNQINAGTTPYSNVRYSTPLVTGEIVYANQYSCLPSYFEAAISAHVFSAGDSRGDTSTGDWSPYYYKSECAEPEEATGLSMTPGGSAHALLCGGGTNTVPADGKNSCHNVIFASGSNRFTTSTGNWDSGYFMGECGTNEYVAGVSQSTSDQVESILCCADAGVAHLACKTEVMANGDARESESNDAEQSMNDGDWDPYYFKGECGLGRYVAGVSRDGYGRPHAILCCGGS